MRADLSGFNEAADLANASRQQPRSQPVRTARQSKSMLHRRPQSAQRHNSFHETGYRSSSISMAEMLSSARHHPTLADGAQRTAQRKWDLTAVLPGTAGLLPGAEPTPAPQPEANAMKAGWLLRSHNDQSATHRQWKRQWVRANAKLCIQLAIGPSACGHLHLICMLCHGTVGVVSMPTSPLSCSDI